MIWRLFASDPARFGIGFGVAVVVIVPVVTLGVSALILWVSSLADKRLVGA